jgi:hypothetical protein
MTARNQAPETGTWARPAGYWTAPCRAWFGAHWTPRSEWGASHLKVSQAATRGRETQLANGYSGSLAGLSKRSDKRLAEVEGPR